MSTTTTSPRGRWPTTSWTASGAMPVSRSTRTTPSTTSSGGKVPTGAERRGRNALGRSSLGPGGSAERDAQPLRRLTPVAAVVDLAGRGAPDRLDDADLPGSLVAGT